MLKRCTLFLFKSVGIYHNQIPNHCTHVKKLHIFRPIGRPFTTEHHNQQKGEGDSWSFTELEDLIKQSISIPRFKEFEEKLFSISRNTEESSRISDFSNLRKEYTNLFESTEKCDIVTLINKILQISKTITIVFDKEVVQFLKITIVSDLLKSDKISEQENDPDHVVLKINFYLTSLLVLRTSDPSSRALIDYCYSQLQRGIGVALRYKDPIQEPRLIQSKQIFILFIKNRGFIEPMTTTLVNKYIIKCLRNNLTQDYSFLLEVVKAVSHFPILKEFGDSYLLDNETPFEPIMEKDQALTEQSEEILQADQSTDIMLNIKDIIKGKLRSRETILTLRELQACLSILNAGQFKNQDFMEDIVQSLQAILESNQAIKTAELIDLCQDILDQIRPHGPFYREILKESLQNIYKILRETRLSYKQSMSLFKLFRHTQTVDIPLLRNIEANLRLDIMKLSKENFLSILFLYSALPSCVETNIVPTREMNIYIKRNFKEFSFENIMDIVIASIQLGFDGKVQSVDYLPTLDCQLWGQILDLMIQAKIPKLTLKEKAKYFRCLKTITLIVEQTLFDTSIIKNKLRDLVSSVVSFDNFESQFQQEVEKYLKDILTSYEKEKSIENILFVDFLVSKYRVLEVNGPTHYFLVYDENGETYEENRSTEFKRKLLESIKYKYCAVAFYEWFSLSGKSEKSDYLLDVLNKKL